LLQNGLLCSLACKSMKYQIVILLAFVDLVMSLIVI
jgi:hypothetical protein